VEEVFELIKKEEERQARTLMLIPSENYTYSEVRSALGSFLVHKYAEGYPGKRYYQGNEFADQVETLAVEEAKKLFGVPFANVQPYSGSPANAAVYFALLNPGDGIMGLELSSGGHLTHGHPKITFSGKYFESIRYGLDPEKEKYFDFEKIRELALKEKPKIIVVGTTAFPRTLNWEKFAQIADEVGAYLMADISHIAGLVVGGVHPSPAPYAHIITSTTHKTLRGPRGAIILVTDKGLKKDKDLGEKINKAVFPGLQGGPHLHSIAGIAIALKKAGSNSFRDYARQVVKNAAVLAEELKSLDFDLVTGGTDNHLMVLDLRNIGIDGKKAAVLLEESGIILNANTIPNDPNPPFRPSGIRLGTPAVTVRGMKEEEMKEIAGLINLVLKGKKNVLKEVETLCERFPIPE
jgi:glycine hydroxymethyltransferase